MKKILIGVFILFSVQTIYVGCTSCKVSKKKLVSPTSTSNFIKKIDNSGQGLALASCGMCNFGMYNKKIL